VATLSNLGSAQALDAALAAPGLLMLDIYTKSCVICRRLEPMVAAVASDGTVRAHKIDAEEHPDFAIAHDIRGVPTLLLFRDGQLIDRRSGFVTASALREWVDTNANRK
jgi:thioredoxin-like negative regulator of GroEL